MHPHLSFRLLPLIAAMAATPLALAETTETPTLDEVVVLGETYRNTATKTSLDPEDTPQSISVIDEETLEMRDADSVATALRYASGVNTELRGGAVSRIEFFNIRGFQNYQNYYDGLQLLYIDAWNLQAQVDLAAVQQVEIFKGPTSTLYGSMPPGGMVNLIGKQPSTESSHQVEVATGSHSLMEATVESQGQLGSLPLSYSLVGLARGKDGQADTTREERLLIAPSLDWQVSDDTLFNVNLYYQKDPAMGSYSSIPAYGMFLDNPNGEVPVDIFLGDENWNTYERDVLMVGYKVNHDFGNGWSFLHNARYTDAALEQKNVYVSDYTAFQLDGRTLSRAAYATDETVQGITMDNQLTALFDTGPVAHSLLFGVDYLQYDAGILYDGATAPDIDLFDPDNDQIDPDAVTLTRYADNDLERHQIGFYTQDQIEIGDAVLIAGLRYDDFVGVDYDNLADTQTTLAQTNLSKRFGALYKLGPFSPFVSYADGFEPTLGADKDGNRFEPSLSEQWEAGIKFATSTPLAQANLAFYRIDKTNVPTDDPDSADPQDLIQAGEVRSQGVEFDAAVQPLAGLLLSLNYTYQDVEYTKDNNGLEGKSPIWVPEQLASVWADYRFTSGLLAGLTTGAGVRYIGEAEIDEANSETVPDATLVDASLGLDVGQLFNPLNGLELGLSVNNLLDERYYSCYSTTACWFGSERTVEASFSYTF